MNEHINESLCKNSFNILGLSSSAELKELRRRSQQLLQLCKIEEAPAFDTDIGNVKNFRSENTIRTALEKVSGIQERLKEVFFWFEEYSAESRHSILLISKRKYEDAIKNFDKKKASSVRWLKIKNLALALMFHAFEFSNLKSYFRALDLWKLVYKSEEFWEFYQQYYLLHDDLGTSSFLFKEFKASVCEFILDKTVDFYHQSRNPEVIVECYCAFKKISERMDREILHPITIKIQQEIERLEKIPSSDLNELSIRRPFKKIQKYFSHLDEFELSEYTPLTILKNDSAEKLRSIILDFYNHHDNEEVVFSFLDQISKLAISNAVSSKIERDKKQLTETIAWKSISIEFDKIEQLIRDEKLKSAQNAYLKLDNDLAIKDLDLSITSRVELLIHYCSTFIQKGHQLFDREDPCRDSQRHAVAVFEHIWKVLNDHLDLVKYNNEKIKEVVDDISNTLTESTLEDMTAYCDKYIDLYGNDNNQEEKNNTSHAVLQLLLCCLCYKIVYKRLYSNLWNPPPKKPLSWLRDKIYQVFVYLVIAFIFSFITRSCKDNSKEHHSNISSSQPLNHEESMVIESLKQNNPEILKKVRKEGYSDKEIARYIIDHDEDN